MSDNTNGQGQPQQTPPNQPGSVPPQYNYYAAPKPRLPRSRLAAGLFAIFFGTFGVHRFYLGNTGVGVAMLLITILSLGFLAFISTIWGIIEGILILTNSPSFQVDSLGNPLTWP